MAPTILFVTYEVMVRRRPNGELQRPHYPGTDDPAKEYASLYEAENFIERHWTWYRLHNANGDPIIVRRGNP